MPAFEGNDVSPYRTNAREPVPERPRELGVTFLLAASALTIFPITIGIPWAMWGFTLIGPEELFARMPVTAAVSWSFAAAYGRMCRSRAKSAADWDAEYGPHA